MYKKLFIGLLLLMGHTLIAQSSAGSPSVAPLVLGERVILDSKAMREQQTINIYRPMGQASAENTPLQVLYVLDGALEADFVHLTGLVQFFQLHFEMLPTVVVGIATTDRKRDFTFPALDRKLKKDYPTTGGSRNFMRYIETEVKPYIEQRFGTVSNNMVVGQDLGGLLAAEILLKNPSLFSTYILVSPSLWWDNEALIKDAPAFLSATGAVAAQVYITMGNEGETMEHGAKRLSTLINQSKKKDFRSELMLLPQETATTILHQGLFQVFNTMYTAKKEKSLH